jgi:nucleoside-diphosphate-sugar epimerase
MAAVKGYRVFVLSRSKPDLFSNEVLVNGSFDKMNNLILPDRDIDFVVNLAGEKRNTNRMRAVNVDAVSELINFTLSLNKARFIHMGSAGVYGIEHQNEACISEKSAVYPVNEYEKTKLEADLLIMKKASENNLDYVILRPTNVFGSNEPGFKLLNLIRAIKNGRFFLIDPNAMVNYIGVKSVCKSVFDAFMIIKSGIICNVNAACRISEFSNLIVEATQTEHKRIRTVSPVFNFFFKIACRIGDFLPMKYQVINSGKYRELTDYRFIDSGLLTKQSGRDLQIELKEEINELVQHYQNKNLL